MRVPILVLSSIIITVNLRDIRVLHMKQLELPSCQGGCGELNLTEMATTYGVSFPTCTHSQL